MTTDKPVPRTHLGVLASATATYGTGHPDDIALPRLPGFVESAFSPLAYEVAGRCLAEPPGGGGPRTAVALAALLGDTTTADLASSRMVAGRVHNPLLFMQATPNSVLGHLSREFGITGQMFSLSTLDDALTELLAMADLLLEDPELDRVLVLGVELGGGERTAAVYRELAVGEHPLAGRPANAGRAAALLLTRPGAGVPVPVRADEMPDSATGPAACPGSIQGLFDLAATHSEARKEARTHAHQ
ncbi:MULTISPECIES: hypothetical protein [Streptomyces]|uniref:Beta-ketoacyl synthase N-terminal domain-containing protein n=1 Tax=Streptomyces koelreuteriae TaxID=2838015 RepID=A0ABX8FKG7_9ACTN|nr:MULTISPECIES: hypothetical protein [Streptomyces]QWB21625.1 hypothetical protein KJK29_02985 [Streptomyces koelreuteriae]UUA04551.1 hypothetical protein NNW98_03000 [Streptomyces koelreuteriae]UUA12176.1 hypothetical protein NNW99_03000 [Streptomyces sp. CRCS-T-1]